MPTMPCGFSPLERYGHNLTRLAKLRTFAPLANHEAVIHRVFEVLQRQRTTKNFPVILASDETRRWSIVAEVIRSMGSGDAPFLRQVIRLDYEALFTNVSDNTAIRQERREQEYAPLREKLAQAKPGSDEEWAVLDELFRWPSLEEWIAPTMTLERLQSMFIAMNQTPGSFVLYVDHFHRLVGGEPDTYPIDASALLKPALARSQRTPEPPSTSHCPADCCSRKIPDRCRFSGRLENPENRHPADSPLSGTRSSRSR